MHYVGRCDQLQSEDLQSYDVTAKSITSATFQRYIGRNRFTDLERELGYRDNKGRLYYSRLTLHTDQSTRFSKGLWKGASAVCCFWSHYHHIWVSRAES